MKNKGKIKKESVGPVGGPVPMSKAEKNIRQIRSKVKNVKRNLLNMTGQQLAKLFKKS